MNSCRRPQRTVHSPSPWFDGWTAGWVERSETHNDERSCPRWVSLRSTHPTFLTTVECAGPGQESAAPKIEFREQSQADLGHPVSFAKIFRFRCRANHLHNSARLTADEGRWPSSRTRGEMRWTLRAR